MIKDLLGLAGLTLITIGVFLVSIPLGFVAAGLSLGVVALAASIGKAEDDGTG